MAYYKVCHRCGACLDPGEQCDCEQEAEEKEKKRLRLLAREERTGQYTFDWAAAEREMT